MELIKLSYNTYLDRELMGKFTGKIEFYLCDENGDFSSDRLYTSEYYLNGQRHRTDGPALEFHNGHFDHNRRNKRWFIRGEELSPMDFFETLDEEAQIDFLWNLDQWL